MKKLSIIAAIAGAFLGGGCACSTLTLVSVDGKPYGGIDALEEAVKELPPLYGDVPEIKVFERRERDTRTEFEIARDNQGGGFLDTVRMFWPQMLTIGLIPGRIDVVVEHEIAYGQSDETGENVVVKIRHCHHDGPWFTAFVPPTLFADDYCLNCPDNDVAWKAEQAYLKRVGELVWRLKKGGAQ